MKLNDVTIGITTFRREKRLADLLRSISKSNIKFKEVIISDDGELTQNKKDIYRTFKKSLPLRVLRLPFDKGVCVSRNNLIKNTKTKYLLLMDDDFQLPKNIIILKEIMDRRKELGGVCGLLKEKKYTFGGASNLEIKNGILIRKTDNNKLTLKTSRGKVDIYYFDFVTQCGIFRMDCLKDGGWDENFVSELEHTDFFMNHKFHTKWKFAITKSVKFPHNPGGSVGFMKKRWNKQKIESSLKYFKKKWGISHIARVSVFMDKGEDTIIRKIKNGISLILPPLILAYFQRLYAKRRYYVG